MQASHKAMPCSHPASTLRHEGMPAPTWQQLLSITATSQAWVQILDAASQARLCKPVRVFSLKLQTVRLVMLAQLDGIVPD